MVLSEFEKSFIREQMLKALDKTNHQTIYSISREDSLRAKEYHENFYSIPENRERKQERDRIYDRNRNNSDINPIAPATRFFPHRSPFEEDNRQKIVDTIGGHWEFNQFPLFLYNPVRGENRKRNGRFEADAISASNHLIVETHEKASHSKKEVQIRDLQKKTIIEYFNWDLIVLTEDHIGFVEEYLQQEWEKILKRRLNGF